MSRQTLRENLRRRALEMLLAGKRIGEISRLTGLPRSTVYAIRTLAARNAGPSPTGKTFGDTH